MNLLTAVIIYWTTDRLGRAIRERERAGRDIPDNLLRRMSPLGWEHILLTVEYRWTGTTRTNPCSVISPPTGIDPKEVLRAGKASGKPLGRLRPEIEALLANGSTHKFIAKRYGTTPGNLPNRMKKNKIRKLET